MLCDGSGELMYGWCAGCLNCQGVDSEYEADMEAELRALNRALRNRPKTRTRQPEAVSR